MKRLGMFSFFSFLFALCFLKVVDDDGAGGADDLLDKDLDDDAGDEGKKADEEKKVDAKPPAIDEKDKAFLEELKQEKALSAIEKEMKAQYGDSFDMAAITSKLQEMEKEKPGSGQALFDRKGIELVHLKHFANKDKGGEFDGSSGRGTRALNADELIDKINKNEASDEERTAFFIKYA